MSKDLIEHVRKWGQAKWSGAGAVNAVFTDLDAAREALIELRYYASKPPADDTMDCLLGIISRALIAQGIEDDRELDPKPYVDYEDPEPIRQAHPDPWTEWAPRSRYNQSPVAYGLSEESVR